jgi:glutamate/tyrosine decarboxylase-like PLP-dependent enzyme
MERDLRDQFDLPNYVDREAVDESILDEVANKMRDNYPYHHPLYAGQMIKPPHPVARKAYELAMQLNPNNHALDGGRASSALEKQAVAEIAKMVGFQNHLGHLTGGGTMANLEALWIASKLHPGKKIVASEQAHYTHSRITEVLKIPYSSIAVDRLGRMSLENLEMHLISGDVGTVVVTLGTTSCGAIDPLEDIIRLCKKYQARIHIDSAYGGYFKLASKLNAWERKQFDLTHEADSLVIDPHKHGMQPYGCGCIIFKNPEVGRFYKHDSPYTYFSSNDLHLGEISLECSRPGAAAVALWATQKQFPLVPNGEFSENLDNCLQAAKELYMMLKMSDKFITFFPPSLDIVLWAPKGESFSSISESSQVLFDACADQDVHLALYKYPAEMLPEHLNGIEKDQDHLLCLRSCLMKPEHKYWVKFIFSVMDELIGS